MLKQYADKIAGYKTHAVQVVAIVVGIASFVWGPIDAGSVHLPKITFDELLNILQVGGGISFLRMGMKKMETPKGDA